MLQENKTENRINPFFAPYNTPHDTVPFDRIRLEDYEEAFMEGIRRDDEATDKIVNDPEEPTFENTLARVDTEKGEHYYDLLSRVSNVFSCMMSAETCDEMEALAQKMSPILTKHANDITLNKKLFERIKFVHDHPNRELNAEEQMLLDTSYDGFVRSGALLDEEGKEKLRQLTEEASMLTLQFSQNLLKENKAFQAAYHRQGSTRRASRDCHCCSRAECQGAGEGRMDLHPRLPCLLSLHDLLYTARAPQADVHGSQYRVHTRQ